MVAGCEVGSCHFLEGNVRAKKRVDYAKKKLEDVGIDPQKLEMYHIAASEGPLFAQTAREFTDRIIQLQQNSGEHNKEDQKQQNPDASKIASE
jgi:coenzyme F420-reducing hydrogenase delta subunit